MRSCLTFFLVLALLISSVHFSGCAASFNYTPLAGTPPGNIDFVYIRSRREPNAVVVQGTLGNNLGFPIYDVLVRGVGYDLAGNPVSVVAQLVPGELSQGKGAPFEIAFETTPDRIVNFQLEAVTTEVVPTSGGKQGGFTQTIGVGSGAANVAKALSGAGKNPAQGWSAASSVFNFANRASQAFPPSDKASHRVMSATHESPVYPVSGNRS